MENVLLTIVENVLEYTFQLIYEHGFKHVGDILKSGGVFSIFHNVWEFLDVLNIYQQGFKQRVLMMFWGVD